MLSLNFCKGGRWMKMKMERRNTDDLRSELMNTPDLTTFLAANEDNFSSASAVARLNEMLEKKGLSKAATRQAVRHERNILAPDFCGTAQSLAQPHAVPVLWIERSLEETQELLRCAASLSSIPRSGATRSSFTGCCMAWTFSPSTTGCSPRTRKRCSDTYSESEHDQTKAPA